MTAERQAFGESEPGLEPLEARIRRTVLTLVFLVGPPALLFLFFKLKFVGLTNPEALDFAQLGRNMSAGRGFVTEIIRPLALGHGANPLNQPEVVHGPLYPFLLALGFGALGAKEWVAALVSGAFYLLTIPVIYALGKRVFNPQVGLIAALVFMVNAQILDYAISGMHITLYIFLATCLLLAIYDLAAQARDAEDASEAALPKGRLILVGVLAAALYLTDPVFFWLAPVALGTVVWLYRDRWVQATAMSLLPFGLLTFGWMLRNWGLTGNPIFGLAGNEILMNTGAYPGDTAYRMLPGEVVPGLPVFKGVIRKIGMGFGEVIEALPSLTASWMLAFFIPSLFFRFTDSAANRLRSVALACAAALLVGTLLFRIQMPLFVTVVPTLLLFSVAFMQHLMKMAQMSRRAVIGAGAVLATLVGYPLMTEMAFSPERKGLPVGPYAEAFGPMTKRSEVILTDQPWLVAWHAESPCLWIPASDKKVPDVMRRFKGVRWMFLTGQVRGLSRSWQSLYDGFAEGIYKREQLRAAKQPYPEKVQVNAKGHPMLDAVSGSTWVPVGDRPTLDVIVATLPGDETKVGMGASRTDRGP